MLPVRAAEEIRHALGRLRPASRAVVSVPGDTGYDEGRRPWQLAVEHRPAVVVRAAETADVAATVRAAADVGMAVTTMTTGHGSVAPADGGVLLNVSDLRAVEIDGAVEVDAAAGCARVAAGTRWSDVLAAVEGTGMAPLCGTVPSLGVVGYTLQGGLGWLSRAEGFAAGDVVSAEMVTATAEVVVARADAHPDLWWGLRGGGGSFGVVTGLTLRLHPVGEVFGGSAYFPAERAEDTLLAFRDWSARQPPWSNAALMLLHVPDRPHLPAELRGRRVLVVRAFATAGEPAAREAMADLFAAAGDPLVEGYRQTGFAEMIAAQGPPPPPVASLERVDLFDRLDDGVVDAMLTAAGPESDEAVACIEIRQWGAALACDPGDRAIAHPTTGFSVITGARYGDRWSDGEVTAAVDGFAAAVAPHANGETLLNLLTDPGLTARAFDPSTWARLRSLKTAWDPDDLIQPGHRIPPI